jgi:putative ABC transport system ATP-binding protein
VELLHSLHASGTSIVVITHDVNLATRLPRRVSIRDGVVLSDSMSGATV